jgi:hypothetical protein
MMLDLRVDVVDVHDAVVSEGHPVSFDCNDFDVNGCNISEVILFLQKLARIPNASSMNMAFTKHITNALIQIREDKLK